MITLTEPDTRLPAVSERLAAIISLVEEGNRAADIGCDHGYVCIHLVKRGISPYAIASDIRKGPAETAGRNIAAYGAADRIEVRIGDGLTTIRPGEAESLIIAGMGGRTINGILAASEETVNAAKELILGPQSETDEVRRFLQKNGLRIVSERLIKEDGKYYPLIRAVKGESGNVFTEEEALFGPVLLRKRDPVLLEYLEQRLCQQEKLLADLSLQKTARAEARRLTLQEERRVTKRALRYYE